MSWFRIYTKVCNLSVASGHILLNFLLKFTFQFHLYFLICCWSFLNS